MNSSFGLSPVGLIQTVDYLQLYHSIDLTGRKDAHIYVKPNPADS